MLKADLEKSGIWKELKLDVATHLEKPSPQTPVEVSASFCPWNNLTQATFLLHSGWSVVQLSKVDCHLIIVIAGLK